MLVRMTDEPDDYEGNWPRDDAMTEWVLVPREPTAKQLIDGAYEVPDPISHRGELTARMVYRAMLDAAPAAPQQAKPVGYFQRDCDYFEQVEDVYQWDADVIPLYLHPPADEVQRLRAEVEALKLQGAAAELVHRETATTVLVQMAEVEALRADALKQVDCRQCKHATNRGCHSTALCERGELFEATPPWQFYDAARAAQGCEHAPSL